MSIANFPDGVQTTGPHIARLQRFPVEYQFDIHRYEDGGADVNVQPCGVQKWVLDYEGLTEAELATLKAHADLAKGRVNDFIFYDRQTATAHTNVRYAEFKIGRHRKRWFRAASVTLVKLD